MCPFRLLNLKQQKWWHLQHTAWDTSRLWAVCALLSLSAWPPDLHRHQRLTCSQRKVSRWPRCSGTLTYLLPSLPLSPAFTFPLATLNFELDSLPCSLLLLLLSLSNLGNDKKSSSSSSESDKQFLSCVAELDLLCRAGAAASTSLMFSLLLTSLVYTVVFETHRKRSANHSSFFYHFQLIITITPSSSAPYK